MARRPKANRKTAARAPGRPPYRKPRSLSAKQLDRALSAGLVLLTALIYVQVVGFGFVNFDDPAYVRDNAHVRDGFSLGGIRWAFTTSETANWYPLTWLSLMADCQLFGPQPSVHHAVNALLHAADVVLLYVALLRMTVRRWPSAAVAALFAVHPLHVESVAWIAERKDVLSTLFFLLALITYDRYVKRPGLGRWSLVFLSMAAGLLCKPMLVTLPFVLLLLDYWPLSGREGMTRGRGDTEMRRSAGDANVSASSVPSSQRPLWLLLVEKLPLLALSVAVSWATIIAQASQGATKMIGDKINLPLQLANAAVAYAKYLAMTVWPVKLATFYPYDLHPRPSLVLGCVAVLAIATVAALGSLRRAPYLAVGWFWYLGTLVPTIGLVQVGAQSLADRYMYIPSIGVFLAIVWLLADSRRGAVSRTRPNPMARGSVSEDTACSLAYASDHHSAGRSALFQAQCRMAVVATVIIAELSVVAHRQTSYWHNSERLFRHALAATTDNPESRDNLGDALLHQDRFAEAEVQFRQVLALDAEHFPQASAELAQAIAGQNRVREAIALVHETIHDDLNRARALNELATFLATRGACAEAIQLLQESIALAPQQPMASRNLAWVYATCPDHRFRNGPKAVELARRACELSDWSNAQFRVTLADAYHEIGDRAHEIEELRAAQTLSPQDAAIARRIRSMSKP